MKCDDKKPSIAKFGLASAYLERYLIKVMRPYKIGFEQVGILFCLSTKECMSISELTAMTPKDKTTISRALLSLEKKGLCEKKIDSKDKRVVYVNITQKGLDKIQELSPIKREVENLFTTIFTPKEEQVLRDMLDKVIKALE